MKKTIFIILILAVLIVACAPLGEYTKSDNSNSNEISKIFEIENGGILQGKNNNDLFRIYDKELNVYCYVIYISSAAFAMDCINP